MVVPHANLGVGTPEYNTSIRKSLQTSPHEELGHHKVAGMPQTAFCGLAVLKGQDRAHLDA